jgi:F-type H+-transporting ATPase subunit gamma
MANIREIQSRMKSIQDTMKITNAMYMISSTKLRKTRKSLDETEQYFYTLQTMLARIMRHIPDMDNKYFDKRPKKPENERVTGIIVVTADKGLAGAYNHNVLKMAQDEMEKHEHYKLFVVGELGRQFFASKHIDIAEHFHYTAQNPSLHRARVISEAVLEQFLNGELDEVCIIYTEMKNSITTEAKEFRLLPLVKENMQDYSSQLGIVFHTDDIVFKPSPDAVIDNIVPDCIMGYVYGALVESFCSEQNARMMAMDAANRNANTMLHDLSIQYNRVRQAMITQEITEVIAGAKAQKRKRKTGKEVLNIGQQ